MPRYCYVVAVLLCSVGHSWAASWADGLFSEHSRDFGSVPRGTVATYPFRVTNTTQQTVHISGVRVSCGCVSARAHSNTLPPGASTVVMCRMDTGRYFGYKTVTVYVTFDRPTFDEVRLSVTGNSRNDIVILPEKLEFGKITQGQTPEKTVDVTLTGNQAWRIVSVQSDSHYVRIGAKKTRQSPGEVVYRLSAQMRSDTPAGKWFTDIWLKTNEEGMPRIRVPLSVEVAKSVSMAPKIITLGEIKAGKGVDRKVVLRASSPFRIVRIKGTDQHLAVQESQRESRTVHVLTVSVRPMQAGQLRRKIEVLTDLETQPKVEFTATAKVVP